MKCKILQPLNSLVKLGEGTKPEASAKKEEATKTDAAKPEAAGVASAAKPDVATKLAGEAAKAAADSSTKATNGAGSGADKKPDNKKPDDKKPDQKKTDDNNLCSFILHLMCHFIPAFSFIIYSYHPLRRHSKRVPRKTKNLTILYIYLEIYECLSSSNV